MLAVLGASFASPVLGLDRASQICVAPWTVTSSDLPLDRRVQATSAFTFSGRGLKATSVRAGAPLVLSQAPVKFRMSVALDGNAMESFVVDTTGYPGGRACMWLYFPYVTWQLGPYVHGRHGCRCFDH
jgi:hypothetical protein